MAGLGFGAPVSATEEPKFVRLLQEGDFEWRRYGPTIVAEVLVDGDLDSASSRGFRQLAGYIFGGNQAVSAVSAAPRSERIAMTAPVTVEPRQPGQAGATDRLAGAQRWRVQFTMPSRYTLASLPHPTNPAVTLRELPGYECAVLTFSGFITEAKVQAKAEALRAWAAGRSRRVTGPPQLLRYDPPWTLPFMRRHELVFELAPATH